MIRTTRRAAKEPRSWESGCWAPFIAIELPVEEGPQKGCRKERKRMSRDVDQHMQPPRSEFPKRAFQDKSDSREHAQKHNKAMGDVVEVMDIERDRGFRRCAVTEIRLVCQTERVAADQRMPNEKRSGASQSRRRAKTRSCGQKRARPTGRGREYPFIFLAPTD